MHYNLKVKRQINTPISSIGEWYLNDSPLKLYSLEDTDRGLSDTMAIEEIKKKKVQDYTAIPTGTYTLTVGYSPKYNQLMLQIKDVKGYSGILIHPLNDSTDTEGCIGVGLMRAKNFIGNSREAYKKLLKVLASIMNFKIKDEAKTWTRIIQDSGKEIIPIKITVERNY